MSWLLVMVVKKKMFFFFRSLLSLSARKEDIDEVDI
jgi:hypothetical protein